MAVARDLFRALKERGPVGTFRLMWQLRTIKVGNLVGEDELGNKYFENTDYPFGHDRWVEYAGWQGYWDVDPSTVSAQWFAWLHRITDTPPTGAAARGAKASDVREIVGGSSGGERLVQHSDAPYDRNLGGVVTDFVPNLTQARPRGYGVGNSIYRNALSVAAGEPIKAIYTQPGNPVSAENEHVRPARRSWSLLDTAETVKARQQGMAAGGALLERAGGVSAQRPAGFDASLTDEEREYVEESNGIWDLGEVEQELFAVSRSLREYDEDLPQDYAHLFDEDGLLQLRKHKDALQDAVRIIKSIDEKWRAAGGAGSAKYGVP